jgi:putative addiction module component (TIGR02574 family)
MTLQQFGIHHLTVSERVELLGLIWDTLEADTQKAPLTEAQRQEMDRRLADHKANPQAAIPWEQVEAEALARLRS